MSYTSVFGGNTIYPSDVSLLAIALSADTELEWPLESSGELPPAARIIDVTPTASGYSVVLPDATLTGAGQTILFNNLSGSYSFYVKDNAGNTLATIAFGTQWQLYLAATTTAAGTWRVFRYGASTATVQPSALAGYGLTVTGSTLSQSLPVVTSNTSNSPSTPLTTSSRATAWVWIGAGAGTLYLDSTSTLGNNFFVFVRNSGDGDLTVTPAGSETINGSSTLVLRPGDSATLITDGVTWYTIGLGQDAVFAFDYTVVNIAPVPPSVITPSTFTLSGSNLNRIAYKFTGALGQDCTIIVPSTIQQYWITNATTGSFTLKVNTSTGSTPVTINQGARGIYYCDGTNVVLADTASISLPISLAQGGTGGTTQTTARAGIGISGFIDPLVTSTSAASARTVISAAASGANSDITSLSGLTTALTVAQGGTGGTTQADARTGLGATTIGANMFTLANPGSVTFPQFNADNTVSALTASAFRTAIGAGSGAGTVTSVGGTGSVNGLTLTGTVTSSGNLTLGGSITSVATTATINSFVIGYRDVPQNAQSGAYPFAASDAGKHIYSTNSAPQTITVPTNASVSIPPGTAITVVNNGTNAITFTTTGVTVYKAGTSAAWASGGTLAVRGMATWLKVATDTWFVSGSGLS